MAEPVKLAFSTFLKYLEFSQKRRVSELKRRKMGKGYRFWAPMEKRAARAANAAAGKLSAIAAEATSSGSTSQKKSNKAALEAINTKFRSTDTLYEKPDADFLFKFGDSNFQIRVSPQIQFSADGRLQAVAIWATAKPILKVETLSVGLIVLDEAFAEFGFEAEPLIYNVVTNKIFRRADLVKNASALHDLAVHQFREAWDEVIGGHPPPPTPPAPWPPP